MLTVTTSEQTTAGGYRLNIMVSNVPHDRPVQLNITLNDAACMQPGPLLLTQWVAEFIGSCQSGRRLKCNGSGAISPSTVKSYKGTLAQIVAYEQCRGRRLTLADMSMAFYNDWKLFFAAKDYSPNTVGRHVRNLKIFLFAAEERQLSVCPDFKSRRFAVVRRDADAVALTAGQVQQLYEYDAPRRTLQEAKDVFVVGCLTGQRISDFKRICRDMEVTLADGRSYLRLTQQKTRKTVYIPLEPRIRAILDRYGGRLPAVDDASLNRRIKAVCRLLGWTHACSGDANGRPPADARQQRPLCDCVTSHTARRSYATIAYRHGVPLSCIMAVTGHSTEQMLRRYLRIDGQERAMTAARIMSLTA